MLLSEKERVGADGSIRSGKKPELYRVSPELIVEVLLNCLAGLKADGMKSIAIISKTAQTAKAIHANLSSKINLDLIIDDDGVLGSLPVILPVYLAKGLEFDAVIIPDAVSESYNREWDDKILYTACTRSLHRLILLYVSPLSPLIERINRDLYDFNDYSNLQPEPLFGGNKTRI